MTKVISSYTHILIIVLGLIGSFVDFRSYWEPLIIGIFSFYEIYILTLNIKLKKFEHFVIIWRLLMGIFLYFPMLPLSIVFPEYYFALFVTNIFHLRSLIVFEILSLVFWLLVVINYLNVRFVKFKLYLIFYIITLVILVLSWIIGGVYEIFGKIVIYFIWIVIFVIEIIGLVNSDRKFK